MKTLQLGHFRNARVWLDEMASAGYSIAQTIAWSIPAVVEIGNSTRTAAIEIMTPFGGRVGYALLGGSFEPNASKHFSVRIEVSDDYDTRPFQDSLVASIDTVAVGLPRAYASGVSDGVRDAAAARAIAGQLTLNCGAHGAVGSSPAAFRKIAMSLFVLFSSSFWPPSDEELAALL